MDRVINELWPHILPLLDKPIALFGHSLGALVAFELAKKIEASQIQQKVILFISACLTPDSIDHSSPLHVLSDEAFIHQLSNYGAMPQQLLENPEALRLLLPRLRADFSIFETYSCRAHLPIKMPIVVFGGKEDDLVPWDQLLAWQKYSEGLFDAHIFSEGIFTTVILLQKFARKLRHTCK